MRRNRLQSEFAIEHMQIPLCRSDESTIGLDEQSFRDQLDRHRGEARKDFVESGGDGSKVINNNDRNTQIRRQLP